MQSRARRLVIAYLVVLAAVNLCVYNYANLYALLHPASDIRLNLYGDPQIEGDAKISREPRIGKYDILFNDYYLHHIYESTIAAFRPHYVVTMGDIFSCQWISKEEYYRRIHRFKWISHQVDSKNRSLSGNHIYYHIAGNHDIGYGEETEPYHINRYTNNFGPLSREWLSRIGDSTHRFAILNAMNLDKTRRIQYRQQAWQFVHQLVAERRERPDIPLILFSHIPLHKHAGACVASPSIKYHKGFVVYQDYLSPATSAYLLHCLAPTFVLSGHDHSGCQAAHSVKTSASQAIPLGMTDKSLRSSEDLCSLTLEEIDEFQAEIEEFARQTVMPATGFDDVGTSAWDTLEVTVRSAMGEFGGAAGVFDIRATDHSRQPSPQRHARTFGRIVAARANGYEYQYREVLLGNHLGVRVLLVVDLVSCLVVPAVLLLLKL
ncbi:hypothetical protein H4218_003809 [Coemansia sp. IMI 209128]|nr:hypothetical protein GGI10_000661 [Coemansia sp. RSA 2530]KAJ2697663.1 hypothetical protein H4218_003809 [Coemansia sp. IMI 209128]